ncbi:MAG: DUF5686 and carboxypeptidase regulatory-like domain-containing protein, partial [Cyclobacteriaceae bacterium]|nr:DUF5686 and carboxypeptidase regulatory-like domain-containing protein [Cyclobacteriaceae bacterium]
MMHRYGTVMLMLLSVYASAQRVRGVVRDSVSQQPVPFAHVTLADQRTGTTSDIDGKFELTVPAVYEDAWYVSHIGYQTKKLPASALRQQPLTIMLAPRVTQLRAVEIVAGENPAWEVIRKVVRNRDTYDPLKQPHFRYTSYTKLISTAEGKPFPVDSLVALRAAEGKPLTEKDSSFLETEDFLQRNRIFVSEAVTEKSFVRPGKHHEKLLAHKVSGFTSPLFASLPNDYQPLGFYNEIVTLLGKDYLNPLSRGSERKYDLHLTDTLYAGLDTLLVVEFEPLPGTSFNGLRGKVTVATPDYAIKNIIAKAADPSMKISFAVQQNYERTDGRWFPTQLNTDIVFLEMKLGTRSLALQARSYLRDLRFEPAEPRLFKGEALNLDASVGEAAMERLRPVPLDSLEVNTYDLYDSLRQQVKLFAVMDNVSQGFISNALPLGPVDLKLNQVLLFNRWESVRLSVGLQTNPKFSKWLTLGGYAGYGFRDKAWKYGGFAQVNLAPARDLFWRAGYDNTLAEAGVQRFFDETPMLNSRAFRDWVAINFDGYESWYNKVGVRVRKDVHFATGLYTIRFDPLYSYTLQRDGLPAQTFRVTEWQGELTYARNQRQVSWSGRRGLLGFEYPVVSLRAKRALPGLLGADNFSYTRLDALAMLQWKHRRLGRTRLTINGGWVNGIAPFNRLYYGRGAQQTSYWVENHFQTMGINEFIV